MSSQTKYLKPIKLLHMQSPTEELASRQSILVVQKEPSISFMLYEEFSRNGMAETIRTRMMNYEKATRERRRELENRAEAEVEDFRRWLEDTKNLKPAAAHYCSISLKSLLLGLPVGLQIAQLFNAPLTHFLNSQSGNVQ